MGLGRRCSSCILSSVGVAQTLGRRERQEDAADVLMGADGDVRLLVLADGMGGAAAGDVAAALIVQTVRETVLAHREENVGSTLRRACDAANDALAAAVGAKSSLAGMGGTLIAVAPVTRGLHFLSVGDSLLLRWRQGRLDRVNADHSIGGALDTAVRKGLMPAEEAATAEGRNRITSALTGSPIDLMRIDETVGPIRSRPTDRWILASDGLATLSTEAISNIMASTSSPQESASALVQAVEQADDPHQDNTTVIVWVP